ncbi:MAG: hypothetical protein D6701_03065 [Gemmatimonadetes bacterium]|nr:MAG: hypothetical protein D6701_03065 [Gemmatimonadota bacterium]
MWGRGATTLGRKLTCAGLLAAAALGGGPGAAGLSAQGGAELPDGLEGTLIVLNKGAATATFLDLASGRRLAVLPTGDGPHELVVSADGRWAVATDYGARSEGHTLTVLDVARLRVARTIELGEYRRPHGIAFLPGDSLVVVTSEAAGAVVLVHVHRGEVVGTAPTGAGGSHMLALTGDGSRIFTSNGRGNSVSEIDVAARRFEGEFAVPARPEAIAVTRAGDEVWVGSNAEGSLTVVDPATGRTERAASGFGWPYRILFTPDERTVLVPDLRGHVLRFFDASSRRETGRLELPGGGPQSMAFYRDPGVVFLSLSAQGRAAVIDVERRAVLGYYGTGPRPDGIGYSPLRPQAAGTR